MRRDGQAALGSISARSLRILVIDDNRDVAEALGLLFADAGHHVDLAHTAAAGLAHARRERPDVILCDLALSDASDGFAVAREVRADSALRGAYVVALSGHGRPEDRRRAFGAGFDEHLTKPVGFAVLERLLDEVEAEKRG